MCKIQIITAYSITPLSIYLSILLFFDGSGGLLVGRLLGLMGL